MTTGKTTSADKDHLKALEQQLNGPWREIRLVLLISNDAWSCNSPDIYFKADFGLFKYILQHFHNCWL